MIRKKLDDFEDWLECQLRRLCAPLSPNVRFIITLVMLIGFSGLSIYMSIYSIYNLGKDRGKRLQIEQIKTLQLQLEQERDSIDNEKNLYEYERIDE